MGLPTVNVKRQSRNEGGWIWFNRQSGLALAMADESDETPIAPPAAPPGTLPSALRAMVREEGVRVRAIGAVRNPWNDIYYLLLHASWGRLLLIFLAVFFGVNLIFTLLYTADPYGLINSGQNMDVPRFWRDFFFSVHTLATIGYGNVYPGSLYANLVVMVEAIVGLLLVALTTGLAFTRFARPTARIMFTRIAVVAPFEGVPTVQLRAINQRHNLIIEARASASVLRVTQDDEGRMMRRFYDLKLVREANPVFALSWTIMHKIDESSPFWGLSPEHIAEAGDEIIVIISGVDQSLAQPIHGRAVYLATDIRWGMRFADILGTVENGMRVLDYRRFNEVEPLSR